MKLYIEWNRTLTIKRGKDLDFFVALEKIPELAGIYIFGRKFKNKFEALYVGQGINIRNRVKGQLNTVKLMRHLKYAKSGRRVLIFGTIKTKQAQKIEKCLNLIERGLIRHFLDKGHDLVNLQGRRIPKHEIISTGWQPKKRIPGIINLAQK